MIGVPNPFRFQADVERVRDDVPAASKVKVHKKQRGAAQGAEAQAAVEFTGQRLPEGQFLVGASKVSIAPVTVENGGQWHPHGDGYDCGQPEQEYTPFSDPSCLRTFDRLWATGVDDLGIYVRALAISNGETTVAFAVMDTIGGTGLPLSVIVAAGLMLCAQVGRFGERIEARR